uniref:Uncharacterized protein n=1 Tax=Romanomermis culicivorax TaxID=13658 RepID=A0A915K349_ROMCU
MDRNRYSDMPIIANRPITATGSLLRQIRIVRLINCVATWRPLPVSPWRASRRPSHFDARLTLVHIMSWYTGTVSLCRPSHFGVQRRRRQRIMHLVS